MTSSSSTPSGFVEIAAWDAGQRRTFVEAIVEHRHRDPFVVAAFPGLRRGELCGLRWTAP